MNPVGQTWAVVLAAGDGTRLRDWTRTRSGIAVPKQFCSLRGGRSLLEQALQRASVVATRARVCVVVAAQHRSWWDAPLWSLRASNVIVQPQNRGTGIGMLFPLMQILRRDPQANIVWLPSDHHVEQEQVLESSLRAAIMAIEKGSNKSILLGMEPEDADPELGYIVPRGARTDGLHDVRRFVEKPSFEIAQSLIDNGVLWNGFIVASRATALLELFQKRVPAVVREMHSILHDGAAGVEGSAISTPYAQLPMVDFSRHIAYGSEDDLRVLRVPRCGWSDLGTPKRLAAILRRLQAREHAGTAGLMRRPTLDLSSQQYIL